MFRVTSGIGALTRPRLFGEDELLDRREASPTKFFRPTDAEQVGSGQRANAFPHLRTALYAFADGGAAVRRHHLFQRRADLGAQLLLLGGVLESHRLGSQPDRHPLDPGHHGGPHPVDLTDQLEPGEAAQQLVEHHRRLQTRQLRADA